MKKMKSYKLDLSLRPYFIIASMVSIFYLVWAAYNFVYVLGRNAFDQGKSAYDREDYDAAIASYTRAIKLGYSEADCLSWRGRVYYDKADFDKAIADFTSAINLASYDSTHYLWRGRAYREKGEYAMAIEDFAHGVYPVTAPYEHIVERGDVYRANGDYDAAIEDYDRAIEKIDLMSSIENRDLFPDDVIYKSWRQRAEIVDRKNDIEKIRPNSGNGVQNPSEEEAWRIIQELFGDGDVVETAP